jgi:pilus assembly protein CpaB
MFRVVLLGFALLAGLAAAGLVMTMQPKATVVVQQQQPKGEEILVAVAELGLGQTLTRESMRWQPWPENMLNPAYITRSAKPDALEKLAGSVLRSRITLGEPILQNKLVPLKSNLLSSLLPPGKRAVAVRISVENTAGGFILPNDRVDVVHTIERQSGAQKHQVSRTILQNVPVLAIDQTVDARRNDEKTKDDKSELKSSSKSAAIGKTATLELDAEQAEVLASAEAEGRLSLSLRSVADNAEAPAEVSARKLVIIRGGHPEAITLFAESRHSNEGEAVARKKDELRSTAAPAKALNRPPMGPTRVSAQ